MAKDKNKNKNKNKPRALTTDEAIARVFGKDAAKRLRDVAKALDAGKGKKKKKKDKKKKKKKKKKKS